MGKGQRVITALSPALIIVIVAGALLIAALTNEGPGHEPTVAEVATELTPRVAEGVEKVRGLQFESLPEPEIVTADDLNALNAAELSRPNVRERLRAEEVVAKLLGLVEFDDDLVGVAEESGDLAAAAYDPRTDELYVVEDAVGVSPALVEFVLAHELNHAIEDQQFDLSEKLGTGDRDLALTSLVEGTATLAMIRYARRFQNTLALSLAASGIDGGTEGVPPFIVDQLLFAYTSGARFVRDLFAETGSWAVVDNALERDPPVSSEQIMHPQKYLLNEGPLAVAPPASPGPGWAEVGSGTLGEFATKELMALASGGGQPERGAAGWGGDRYVLWQPTGASDVQCEEAAECRQDFALAIRWTFDSVYDLRQFLITRLAYIEVELEAAPVDGGWTHPNQGIAQSIEGRTVTLALAPTLETAQRIVGR